MRFWEPHLILSGDGVERYGADLYRQPLWRHLYGELAHRFWHVCDRAAPWLFEPHGSGWRLNFELACSYDIPHRGRELIASVDLPARPKDWPEP